MPGEPREPQIGQSNQEKKTPEQLHQRAYNFLTNVPEGLEATDWRLKDWSKMYNETICIAVAPEQTEKDWVVYYDGKASKIAPITDPGRRPRAYLVYQQNGGVWVSHNPVGIEVKYAAKYKKQE